MIYGIVCLIKSKLYVDRRRSPGLVFSGLRVKMCRFKLGVFSGEGGSKRITTYPVQVRHTLGVGAGS